MIKKLGALAMVSVLSVGMVACSGEKKDKPEKNTSTQTEQSKNDKTNTSSTSESPKNTTPTPDVKKQDTSK